MNSLTLVETHDLQQCESIIKKGQTTFFEVGVALIEIRDRKLFRGKYETFEDYCIHRWGWTRQRGYQLADAAQIAKACQPVVVGNERIARELGKLPDGEVKAVAEELSVTEEGLTAKAVRQHLRKNSVYRPFHDQSGYPIPRDLVAMWARRAEIQAFMATISSLKCHLEKARAEEDPLFQKLDQSVIEKLESIFHSLREAKPAFVCGICQGRLETLPNRFCKACGSTGFMSEYEYETFVPIEVRQLRRKESKIKFKYGAT